MPVTLTGYAPIAAEGGPNDMRGRPLATLQAFRAGLSEHVSVALDVLCVIPYGTLIEIPSLADGPVFVRVDNGPAFFGRGLQALDVCVEAAYELDDEVNCMTDAIYRLDLPPWRPDR
jgi:hypothetical protein